MVGSWLLSCKVAAERGQVKANHAQKKSAMEALDEAGPEGCGLCARLFGSMWMNCSHLLRRARTRWVTERIASTGQWPAEQASGIKDEMTGSSSACETDSSGSSEST